MFTVGCQEPALEPAGAHPFVLERPVEFCPRENSVTRDIHLHGANEAALGL